VTSILLLALPSLEWRCGHKSNGISMNYAHFPERLVCVELILFHRLSVVL
jgi:hypothetical protein